MDQERPKPSKRLDLQGIRALAIIVVLGFHFFSEYCPNGYLGVDQFFVLSGFLMCMLLKRAETESPCSLNMVLQPHQFDMARKRNTQLVKDCNGKCILIDYVPEFFNKDTKTFRYFDEKGFSYLTTISHLSPHRIEHVRHVWTDICRKL